MVYEWSAFICAKILEKINLYFMAVFLANEDFYEITSDTSIDSIINFMCTV